MRASLTTLLVALASLFAFLPAHAIVITFDDLPDTETGLAIPAGYDGFNWTNFSELDGENYPPLGPGAPPTGYNNGVVSPNNVAYNAGSLDATLAPASSSTFTLTSGYFTSAFFSFLPVRAYGYGPGNTLLYSGTFDVVVTGTTLETFDWTGLSSVVFSSALAGGAGGSGTEFVLDNLNATPGPPPVSFVPEPTGLALPIFFLGMAAIGGLQTLRRRAALPPCCPPEGRFREIWEPPLPLSEGG